MDFIDGWMDIINGILWHDYVLYTVLGTGILFTLWSRFSQFRSLTHGIAVIRGKYDRKDDPGAINHFQALSAALSATVGLGNIGGVAIAVALGGPGAVFWMWVVGLIGMALKLTEVTQAMLYRNTDDSDNPHGGAMWVASKGFAQISPKLSFVGKIVGGIFCITLLISAITGGNMFQAWNVGILTKSYFGVPEIVTGIILTVVVGAVIIGGIKRIGAVAGRLVPLMVIMYFLAAVYVLAVNIDQIPHIFSLILKSAFNPGEAEGAFLGAGAGIAFMWGMKRALFSNEAGQGSAPIAHSAAKTDEPVREGIVAGLGPFIDTIIVCSLTAFVILVSGAWNRGPESFYENSPEFISKSENSWTLNSDELPKRTPENFAIAGEWQDGEGVFVIGKAGEELLRLDGIIEKNSEGNLIVHWDDVKSDIKPELREAGIYATYAAAALTSYSFDRVHKGLGLLVPIVAWLFAVSTMISWSYYGEQGVIYLLGQWAVFPYKVLYCLLILVACSGILKTAAQLDNLTGVGTGVMLFANIPILLIFGGKAMKVYKEYISKLDRGEFKSHDPHNLVDLVEGEN